MALVENLHQVKADSEMEEGEIVDDLSDISSEEEEMLLRHRLYVLETLNNVLERKETQGISLKSDFEDVVPHLQNTTNHTSFKSHDKQKRKKELTPLRISTKNKDYKKKAHRKKKEIKILSETSEESDDEYRNKRRKLANAVSVDKIKNDTSSLSARLKKMLHKSDVTEPLKFIDTADPETTSNMKSIEINKLITDDIFNANDINKTQRDMVKGSDEIYELIDLCDDNIKTIDNQKQEDIITEHREKNEQHKLNNLEDSDEDLELLRQHALKTKSSKVKFTPPEIFTESENTSLMLLPEDDETYTAQLRMICLKSAYLKKTLARKRRRKNKKKLSSSSILQDDLVTDEHILSNQVDSQNNTDIESVDMDIGSDVDEKGNEFEIDSAKINDTFVNGANIEMNENKNNAIKPKEDELDEDEDLLRAKLLTSLSKNFTTFIDPTIIKTIDNATQEKEIKSTDKKQIASAEPKRFIIKLGESDSEEHDTTKELTDLHKKQSKTDFDQQLDMFLKYTRMTVERQENPANQQSSVREKPPNINVSKSMKNLPKSVQLEYKSLVKRMVELEKIKKARQSSMNLMRKSDTQMKETLKPRNFSNVLQIDNMDEQIAMSRKKIANESANMLRLKDEASKLSQKYKIVATELRNIATAITLNSKQQKSVQSRLSRIRLQHQSLLKSSNFKHSQNKDIVVSLNRDNSKNNIVTKLQKENNPSKEDYMNPHALKSVKVNVVNDFKDDVPIPRLSVQIDVTNNKKVVKLPKSPIEDTNDAQIAIDADSKDIEQSLAREKDSNHGLDKLMRRNSREVLNDTSQENRKKKKDDDYKSPLEALDAGNWKADPNGFLCPFEVGGNCKDPDCKYVHTNAITEQ